MRIERDENEHLTDTEHCEYQMQKKSLWWKKMWIYKFCSFPNINSFWLFAYIRLAFAAEQKKTSSSFNNNRLWRRKISILNSIMYTIPISPGTSHHHPRAHFQRKTVKCTLIKIVLLNSWGESDNSKRRKNSKREKLFIKNSFWKCSV